MAFSTNIKFYIENGKGTTVVTTDDK